MTVSRPSPLSLMFLFIYYGLTLIINYRIDWVTWVSSLEGENVTYPALYMFVLIYQGPLAL